MTQQTLTSREFLNAVGVSTDSGGDQEGSFPIKHRHLLIASVLECISAQKLRKALEGVGLKAPTRDVLEWQSETREWLGLPPARPGKPSAQYLGAIQEWREANGNPSWEEIDAGWIPTRSEEPPVARQLSPHHKKQIEDHRRQCALLNSAKSDDEVRRLLTQFMQEMGRAWQIPFQPQPSAEEEVRIEEESRTLETSSWSEPPPQSAG